MGVMEQCEGRTDPFNSQNGGIVASCWRPAPSSPTGALCTLCPGSRWVMQGYVTFLVCRHAIGCYKPQRPYRQMPQSRHGDDAEWFKSARLRHTSHGLFALDQCTIDARSPTKKIWLFASSPVQIPACQSSNGWKAATLPKMSIGPLSATLVRRSISSIR